MAFIKLTATANPQDYFEGGDAADLRVERIYNADDFQEAVRFAERCCLDGYTVILTYERGEVSG